MEYNFKDIFKAPFHLEGLRVYSANNELCFFIFCGREEQMGNPSELEKIVSILNGKSKDYYHCKLKLKNNVDCGHCTIIDNRMMINFFEFAYKYTEEGAHFLDEEEAFDKVCSDFRNWIINKLMGKE